MLRKGTRLGRYEILGSLGAGGMGEVYRARDPELRREVAVKVLPEDLSRDVRRLRRFRSEAHAVGALNHPNVISVFDIGVEDDRPYLVTELLTGRTLRERFASGALDAAEALDVARQLANGLVAAHDRGIVHRDLKPENIWLCSDGTVKILDFGLARLSVAKDAEGSSARTLTQSGTILGTAGYMSPEQITGSEITGRSDLFSLGAVLYEAVVGRKAFPGRTIGATLAAVLGSDPAPIPASTSQQAAGIARIALRCLAKEPVDRFQSARDVLFALDALAGDGAEVEGDRSKPPTSKPHRRALAVLLFRDLSGREDNQHLSIGLTEAIIAELAELPDLIVRPTAAVLRYRNRELSPEEAGSELGVDVVLDGSYQRSGSRLRIVTHLVDVGEASSFWGAKIDGSLQDVFALQDAVSQRVAEALSLKLSSSAGKDQARGESVSARAYELYLRGKFHLHREGRDDVMAAVDCFETASELAPRLALAWVGLGEACLRVAWTYDPEGGWYQRAEKACREALKIAPDLPDALYLEGRTVWSPASGFDHEAGLRALYRSAQERPNFHDALHYLGIVLFHVGILDVASDALGRALEIDPEDLVVLGHLGFVRFVQSRFQEGLEIAQSVSLRSPTAWSRYCEAICHLRMGEAEKAQRQAATLARDFPDSVWIDSLQGLLAAVKGDERTASRAIDRIVVNQKAFGHYHHAQHDMAVIQAQLGHHPSAVEWLEAAATNGFPCAPAFSNDPLLQPLKGFDRFDALLENLAEQAAQYRSLYDELRSET